MKQQKKWTCADPHVQIQSHCTIEHSYFANVPLKSRYYRLVESCKHAILLKWSNYQPVSSNVSTSWSIEDNHAWISWSSLRNKAAWNIMSITGWGLIMQRWNVCSLLLYHTISHHQEGGNVMRANVPLINW